MGKELGLLLVEYHLLQSDKSFNAAKAIDS